MTLKMVTANRLDDGVVVYLVSEGRWVERCRDGTAVADDDAAAELLAAAERDVGRCLVIAPYLIDVALSDGAPRPLRYREVIRAAGPSVRGDLGKQAEGH
jgi:hypothetical protein